VIGLDFGTSTSFIAQSSALRNAIVPLGVQERFLPSIAGISGSDWYLCEDASLLPEKQILRSAKRLITRRKTTALISNGTESVEVHADDVITAILSTIARLSETAFVGLGVEGEVRLGCPAIWQGDQRERYVELATRSGIAVGDNTIIDEPIAAGVAWVSNRLKAGSPVRGKVLVFDMGGGTLDVAVLYVDATPGREPSIAVQAAVGADRAGDSLDDSIARDLADKFAILGLDISSHPQRAELEGWLRAAARKTKIELTTLRESTIVVGHPTVEFPPLVYSREELEDKFAEQISAAMDVVWWALRAALMAQVKSPTSARQHFSPEDARRRTLEELVEPVEAVVLAGGMSNVPIVLETLAQYFGDRVYLGSGNGEDIDDLIALGLAHDGMYERMNLHRPGFDFVLQWEDRDTGESHEQTVYRAYTPLYTDHTVYQTNSTKYKWAPKQGSLPSRGDGLLVVRSLSGDPIDFKLPTKGQRDHLPFHFGHKPAVITLQPNGHVFLRDGVGYESSLRIAQWPVIRGRGNEALVVEPPEDDRGNFARIEALPWHLKPYD